MPLVRIDLRKGKDAAYRQEIGRVVYEALIGVGVPKNDRFQVIGQYDAESFLFDPDYLGLHRSEELVIIQITWNQGRSMEQKKGALQSYCRRPALGRWAPARGRFYQSYRGQQRKLVVWQRRSPVRELLMQTVTAQSLADASRNETGWTPA